VDLETLPVAPTPARVRLGRWLFYDVRLSRDNTVACATCHVPEKAFSIDRANGIGIHGQRTRRKPPALLNLAAAFYPWTFRDGRARNLEEQALQPISNPSEMGNSAENLVATLRGISEYRPYFAAAFGTGDITPARVAQAIADYERTRLSGNSPWDRWRRYRDESAVSNEVKRGHRLFFGRAGCNQCHIGGNFTDSSFHNIGIGWNAATHRFGDVGRALVTNRSVDRGAFKTPTLRDVAKHPPYMHNGSVATLRDVIVIYNRGGTKNPFLDHRLKPLNLSERDMDDLLAFLRALDGEGYADASPGVFPNY
jgi:cytochrome c peroxidase